MAVSLIKPDGEDTTEAVESAAANGGVTADQPSRPRAWLGHILQTLERHADAPRAPGRAIKWADLSAYHAFNHLGLTATRVGAGIILRGAWSLMRRGVVLAIAQVSREKWAKSTTKPAVDGDTEGSGKAKGRGGKSASGKKKGKRKAPAEPKKTGTMDLLVGGAVLVGMTGMFIVKTAVPTLGNLTAEAGDWVAEHPSDTTRGTGFLLIMFVVASWTVGVFSGAHEKRGKEGCAEGEGDGAAGVEYPEGDLESGESGALPGDGEADQLPPEEEAERERIMVYAWVRGSLASRGNGTAVHLRELALDSLPEGGDMRAEIGRVRALLGAHEIPIRDGVKAPASDKNGASRNRPGVHRDDFPQTFTPLPSPGSNQIRLLPVGQPPDLQ
ncbi:hypothetical protein [Streptomyces sp. NBC_00470]|uniref:hypothetical protein n=1 Tax=Streptomyces sp. NBC_00470 TaxID=2975753 RepID=UPI002F917A99